MKTTRIKRQHVNPVRYQSRMRYLERMRERHGRSQAKSGRDYMMMLENGLGDPLRARKCAERLLSDYTYAELGVNLYMRCRRLMLPPVDPIRAKVAPKGKPGRLNHMQTREYRQREVVEGIKEMLNAACG